MTANALPMPAEHPPRGECAADRGRLFFSVVDGNRPLLQRVARQACDVVYGPLAHPCIAVGRDGLGDEAQVAGSQARPVARKWDIFTHKTRAHPNMRLQNTHHRVSSACNSALAACHGPEINSIIPRAWPKPTIVDGSRPIVCSAAGVRVPKEQDCFGGARNRARMRPLS